MIIGLLWVPVSLLFFATGANAATIEKQAAMASRTRIAVEVGIGHTINFSNTGEKVYRAWIGDGGQCLQVQGGSPLEQGTQIINLRRFQCQNNTAFQPVGETVITLTTQDNQGELSVYEFVTRYSDRGESITHIVDTPPSNPSASSTSARTALNLNAVRMGLATFDLEADSPVAEKVEAWARAVESGSGHRRAAQAVDIDWALLERLNQIGLRAALVPRSTEL